MDVAKFAQDSNEVTPKEQKPIWLEQFVEVYQSLSTDNLHLLEQIYHRDVTFVDPMHKVSGRENLITYFEHLYSNLSHCQFDIDNSISDANQAAVYWTMSYQHPKLNRGEKVTVAGSSLIKAENNRVIYHRDYLDIGAMLYEQLPVIGRLIRWIKAKAVS